MQQDFPGSYESSSTGTQPPAPGVCKPPLQNSCPMRGHRTWTTRGEHSGERFGSDAGPGRGPPGQPASSTPETAARHLRETATNGGPPLGQHGGQYSHRPGQQLPLPVLFAPSPTTGFGRQASADAAVDPQAQSINRRCAPRRTSILIRKMNKPGTDADRDFGGAGDSRSALGGRDTDDALATEVLEQTVRYGLPVNACTDCT